MTAGDRDHLRDIVRLRRYVLALEERLGRPYGVRVPKALQKELARTGMWANEIFVAYGLEPAGDEVTEQPDG